MLFGFVGLSVSRGARVTRVKREAKVFHFIVMLDIIFSRLRAEVKAAEHLN